MNAPDEARKDPGLDEVLSAFSGEVELRASQQFAGRPDPQTAGPKGPGEASLAGKELERHGLLARDGGSE
eukprot:6067663-Pyramimonas_sp.AAC.1